MARFRIRMNSLAVAAAMALAIGAMSAAPAAEAQKLTEAQALNLQQKFESAQLAGDAAAVGALMADNSVFVHGNMRVQTKAEFVASVGKGGPTSFEGKDRKVILFDNGALVTGPVNISLAAPAAAGGSAAPPRQLHIYLSTLWTHTAAGWQEILSQTTELPPAGAPGAAPPGR
jgi:ketosteroid isomerase-like protein